MNCPLILGSRSPRRAELLSQVGLSYSVRAADIDETPRDQEFPADYVMRMAREKAAALTAPESSAVLTADTSVVIDNAILGKPADDADAAAMLRRLSGRCHQVMSAVALRYRGVESHSCVVTEVQFASLEENEIAAYVAAGEGRDKAGSYAIQGQAAAFVEAIRGSYSGVVGLPLHETITLLRNAGVLACLPPCNPPCDKMSL
ncbi:septum formation inhibitor Maf [Spongiibacter nanhainus]|uniref:dTTP/UTP pyrophosphatase n=1 Tax=Spongiibacter nanhainus TaxID=2794344 RepID=A0A7T4US82_9GAMM|nr:septum formation inhibitor Maf [Spongiibacter nanhainus]